MSKQTLLQPADMCAAAIPLYLLYQQGCLLAKRELSNAHACPLPLPLHVVSLCKLPHSIEHVCADGEKTGLDLITQLEIGETWLVDLQSFGCPDLYDPDRTEY